MQWKKWLSYIWPWKIDNGYSMAGGESLGVLKENPAEDYDEASNINLDDFKSSSFYVRKDGPYAVVNKVIYRKQLPYGYEVELPTEGITLEMSFRAFQIFFRSSRERKQ